MSDGQKGWHQQGEERPLPRSHECYNQLDLAGRIVFPRARKAVGEWLSLVEHLVRDQGVGGSNPLSPTILFKYISATSGFPSTSMVSRT